METRIGPLESESDLTAPRSHKGDWASWGRALGVGPGFGEAKRVPPLGRAPRGIWATAPGYGHNEFPQVLWGAVLSGGPPEKASAGGGSSRNPRTDIGERISGKPPGGAHTSRCGAKRTPTPDLTIGGWVNSPTLCGASLHSRPGVPMGPFYKPGAPRVHYTSPRRRNSHQRSYWGPSDAAYPYDKHAQRGQPTGPHKSSSP